MKLPITYYGDPLLRKKGKKIEEISEEIKQLVADMIETMDAKNGLGLAAPQVGHSLRLFITRPPIENSEGEDVDGELQVFINPVFSSPSEEGWINQEGCISIPGVYGDVERPERITVEAQDLDGNTFKKELSGWEARVAMHENDHINGVLYIDRMTKRDRQKIDPELKKLKKRLKKK